MPMIDWDIFDFSSSTAEQNLTKFDRKQVAVYFREIRVLRWPPWFLIRRIIFDSVRYFTITNPARHIPVIWEKKLPLLGSSPPLYGWFWDGPVPAIDRPLVGMGCPRGWIPSITYLCYTDDSVMVPCRPLIPPPPCWNGLPAGLDSFLHLPLLYGWFCVGPVPAIDRPLVGMGCPRSWILFHYLPLLYGGFCDGPVPAIDRPPCRNGLPAGLAPP